MKGEGYAWGFTLNRYFGGREAMKSNKIANVLFIIGIVIMVFGFIMGLEMSPDNTEFFEELESKDDPKSVSKQEELFIREHHATGQVEIDAIINTPFSGLCLV